MNKHLVLQIKFGGLGDHLFFSHLPRIAKQHGGCAEVYISNQSPFRSPEYKELVWKLNPFVDGFVDEPGRDVDALPADLSHNLLDAVMLAHELDDGVRFHEPELYYRPSPKAEFAGKSLYDPNYVSFIGFISSRHIQQWFRVNNVLPDCQMALRDKSLPAGGVSKTARSTSLRDFCDTLSSVESLYCLGSGTATLAAALGIPATVFYGNGYNKALFCHSRRHSYIYLHNAFPWPRKAFFYWMKAIAQAQARYCKVRN